MSGGCAMQRLRMSGFDERLLQVLQMLLIERSVSRTAAILGQSVPAISLALRRIRKVVGDPVLVRSGSRLVPTERGLELLDPVSKALESLERIVGEESRFFPASAEREIRIATANCLAAFLLPRLVQRVRAEAPGIRLLVRSIEPEYNYAKALEQGELDVVIGDWPMPPASLRIAPLLEDDIVCMVRADHPMAQRTGLTMDEYLQLDHLSPTSTSTIHLGPIGGRLAQLGLERRIMMYVPEFNLVPYVLLRSDLVFTTGRRFAEHWASFFPIRVLPAPPELTPMSFYLLWHDRSHRAACNIWLRGLLREVAQDFSHPEPPVARPRHTLSMALRSH